MGNTRTQSSARADVLIYAQMYVFRCVVTDWPVFDVRLLRALKYSMPLFGVCLDVRCLLS